MPASWSPRYLYDASKHSVGTMLRPEAYPPLTPQAVHWLESGEMVPEYGVCWGAGAGTPWVARRVKNLLAVEHDLDQGHRVHEWLCDAGIDNVHVQVHDPNTLAYAMAARSIAKGSLAFALVAGEEFQRDACANVAVRRMCEGGRLVLADAHRYLPAYSRCPGALGPDRHPPTTAWTDFRTRVAQWSAHYTTNGVTDTAIWTRPPKPDILNVPTITF